MRKGALARTGMRSGSRINNTNCECCAPDAFSKPLTVEGGDQSQHLRRRTCQQQPVRCGAPAREDQSGSVNKTFMIIAAIASPQSQVAGDAEVPGNTSFSHIGNGVLIGTDNGLLSVVRADGSVALSLILLTKKDTLQRMI